VLASQPVDSLGSRSENRNACRRCTGKRHHLPEPAERRRRASDDRNRAPS